MRAKPTRFPTETSVYAPPAGARPVVPSASPDSRPDGSPSPRGYRQALRRLGEWALLLALFGVTAEVACRIEDRIRFGTPLLSRYRSVADLFVRDEDGMHGRPNAGYQQWKLNNLGLRGPDVSPAKPAGTIRVITVGASETFGMLESTGREYPRQLQDSLNALARACEADGTVFEVLNAGLPGMTLPTIEQHTRARLQELGPDVMVVYPSPVQYLDKLLPRAARPDSTPGSRTPPVAQALHPRFAQRMRTQVKALLPEFVATYLRQREIEEYRRRHGPDARFSGIPADRMSAFEGDLRSMVGTVRASGAVPVVVTHANALMRPGPGAAHQMVAWEKFYPLASGPTIVAFDSAARGATLDVAADLMVTSVDLAGILTAGPTDALFTDFTHFSDEGAGRVAGSIAPSVFAASGGCRADRRSRAGTDR